MNSVVSHAVRALTCCEGFNISTSLAQHMKRPSKLLGSTLNHRPSQGGRKKGGIHPDPANMWIFETSDLGQWTRWSDRLSVERVEVTQRCCIDIYEISQSFLFATLQAQM